VTPEQVAAALDEARTLLRARQHEAALARLRALVQAAPSSVEAHFMLGLASAELRDFPSAIASLDRAFSMAPPTAPGRLAFAHVLVDGGDPQRAEREAREALRLKPRWVPALDVLALALQRMGREAEALGVLGEAIEVDPRNYDAHLRRARLLHRRAQVHEAIDAYRTALALDAGDADAWNELAIACSDAALHADSRAASREALQRRPSYHQVESNVLIALHYDPMFGPDAMYEAHRDWNARHAGTLAPTKAVAVPRRALAPGERLRVGFLSPALRAGPTGYFALPVFEHLDRSRFELHGYNANGTRDALTDRLQRLCSSWHDAWTDDDEALAARIRADGIDILVDLAGHTPGGRLLVLARKPAPVIATWLDYFDTTGLDAVDYLVGDPVSTPEGGSQRFSERVIHIDPCRLCYSPPAFAPDVAPPPALRKGFVTFGCFNRRSKITPEVISAWSTILQELPTARLLIKNAAMADARMRESMLRAFERFSVERDRVELRAHSPHEQMLAEYADVDIALDPFPYNGGLTTCESLWMGVPVLAIEGDSMISRQSAALLAAGGLGDWVVRDEDALLESAIARAGDVGALAPLRDGLRARLGDSPLMKGEAFARKFGEALLAMWKGD